MSCAKSQPSSSGRRSCSPGARIPSASLRLAEKAFRPSDIPMPLLNIDTGHHFPELNEFRDRRAGELGAKLIIRRVEDAIAAGIALPAPGEISRNRLQIPTLLAAIEEFRFDCCIGGARRDEEKARAKERFLQLSRRLRPMGSEEPASGNLESLQRAR